MWQQMVVMILAAVLVGGCAGTDKRVGKATPIEEVRPRSPVANETSISVSKQELRRRLKREEVARIIEVFYGRDKVAQFPRYRVFDVRPQGTLALLGLRNGDVIEAVHGYVLPSAAVFSKYIEGLLNEEQTSLEVLRVGLPLIITINLVE